MTQQLNKYIATEIMGLCWHEMVTDTRPVACVFLCQHCRKDWGYYPANPDYSSSLDLIHAVLDKVLENGFGVLIGNVSDGWRVCFSKPAFLDKFRDVHAEAYSATNESLPLAIAMACQKAMEGK